MLVTSQRPYNVGNRLSNFETCGVIHYISQVPKIVLGGGGGGALLNAIVPYIQYARNGVYSVEVRAIISFRMLSRTMDSTEVRAGLLLGNSTSKALPYLPLDK